MDAFFENFHGLNAGYLATTRSTMPVVDWPSTSGNATTRPPQLSTSDRADDAVEAPIRALHQNIRTDPQDRLERRVFVEGCDKIDHFERGEHLRPFVLIEYWTVGPFKRRTDSSVLIATTSASPNARAFEKLDMTRMKDVVTPVCEYDFPTGGLEFPNLFGDGVDGLDH